MTVTGATILDGLRRLGVQSGDVLLVHSSMKSLGWVEGGPEAVVDALIEAVGPDGLLIVPTFSRTIIRRDTGHAQYAYDRATTPATVGLIPNTVRQRPDALRSGHPTHSLTAVGPRAAELVADGPEPYRTFDRTGPYGRYVRWGAKVLLLGCGLNANTTFHAIEDWLELPYIARRRARALIRQPDGTNVPVNLTMCPGGHRDFYAKDRRTKIEHVLCDAGVLTVGSLAKADSILFGARPCLSVTARRIETDPGVLLCDDATCDFCAQGQRDCLADLDGIRARARRLREEGFLD